MECVQTTLQRYEKIQKAKKRTDDMVNDNKTDVRQLIGLQSGLNGC